MQLIVIVRKDMPSPSVGNFHVKNQHKHNLAIRVDVEVSSPCGKNMTILLLKLIWILLQWYVKKDVRTQLKLVDNSSEEEEKAIDFNDTVQDGMLLPLTHKDDTQEESESHEVVGSARNKSLKHLNVG